MRHIPKILCLATLTLILLIVLQGATQHFEFEPLKGVYISAEKPRFTFDDFVSGKWQRRMEGYVKDHQGFREPAIRRYNQYLWSLYHRSTNPNSVVVGKDNYLFEPWFVDEYYTGCFNHFYPDSLLIPGNEKGYVFFQRMSRLTKLQYILEEQGVHLFLALLPGKERIYPQYLPAPSRQALHERMEQGLCSAYDHYSGWSSFYGFRCVDICHCFDSLRGHTPYLLFTKTGTHWSNIASTYAFDTIMRYMQTFGPPIRPVVIGNPYYAPTRDPDADLDGLLNKMTPIPTECNQYVDISLGDPAPARNPSLVVIGDSFFWNILYNYPIQDLFDHFRYWYYFSTIYYDPAYETVADIDLVDELLSADYVMLSYCTVQLYNCGNGFINRALLELCYDPEEIQSVRDSLAADTTSRLSVDQRIDLHLEQFFPALAEPFPTKRSSRITHKVTSDTSDLPNNSE